MLVMRLTEFVRNVEKIVLLVIGFLSRLYRIPIEVYAFAFYQLRYWIVML